MKTLVIYYSYEGNTEFIAKTIAEHLGADLLKLEPENEQKHTGFMKYIWGGKQVFFNRRPELKPFDKNPSDYDRLIIGTPVWAFSFAPAFNSFFEKNDIENKHIALFCCSGGGKGEVFKNMRLMLEGNEIIGEMAFIEPLSHDSAECAQRAIFWVEGLSSVYKE